MDVGVEIAKQYMVIEHVGRGGMADVWSARDLRLARMVAVKTVARDLSQDMNPLALFEREALTIAQLEHPHILPIYDFGEFESRLYIVMRFVTGGSLEDLLADGPLSLHEALTMGERIAAALDYAHENSVIHLDLKPANVLLDTKRSPYLADFGLASIMGPEGRATNPGSGTLLYMAPEQLTAEELDHRADVYSFAIMLSHMLTGALPFEATTGLAIKQLQEQVDLPDLAEVSPDLPGVFTDVLREATSMNVETRPNTLSELLQELRSVMPAANGRPATPGISLEADDDLDEEADVFGERAYTLPQAILSVDDMALLEAVDIYHRAHNGWAAGKGRFLLGVTHFMLMNDYYKNAEHYELEIDNAGRQVLLRGAIEYDQDIDYWWERVDAEDRRWVTLHAIRSENAPARVRAFGLLEALPMAGEPLQIPKLVAQAIQLENNADAKSAAINVLDVRAKLMVPEAVFDIKKQTGGGMLTTRLRQVVQIAEQSRELIGAEKVYFRGHDFIAVQGALLLLFAFLFLPWLQITLPSGEALGGNGLDLLTVNSGALGEAMPEVPLSAARSLLLIPVLGLGAGLLALSNIFATRFRRRGAQYIFAAGLLAGLYFLIVFYLIFVQGVPQSAEADAANVGLFDLADSGFWVGLLGMAILLLQLAIPRFILSTPWRPAVYNAEIDSVLAEAALDPSMPDVAELAARTIGRIRSLAAVRKIAEAQREGIPGALRGLALIRNEAPSLPPVVSIQAQVYAWMDNTWHRISEDPMAIVWRYLFALFGGWIAMGLNVYITFRSEQIFNQQRWANTIAVGLVFGVVIGFIVLFADELSARMRNFWPWWVRLELSVVLGWVVGMLAWGSFSWFFLNISTPPWDLRVMWLAGLGISFGFAVSAMLNFRGWAALIVTGVLIYVPLFLGFRSFWFGQFDWLLSPFEASVLYYDFPRQIFTVTIPVAVIIALGGHARKIWHDALPLLRTIWQARRRASGSR